MTPEERAEKIVDKFWGSTEPTVIDRQMVKAIAAEMEAYASERVRAAVEEAEVKKQIMHGMMVAAFDQRDGAKAEAYEEAAKIAEQPIWDAITDARMREIQKGLLLDVADAIRARAAEVGK